MTRFKHIPGWAIAIAGVAATCAIAAWLWDTTGSGKSLQGLRALLIGLGLGTGVSMLLVIADVLIHNLWPPREERRACAEILSHRLRNQLVAAVWSNDPAGELSSTYRGDRNLAAFQAPFGSSEILESIRGMHEGAFLAAIHLWDEYNDGVMPTGKHRLEVSELEVKIMKYRLEVAEQIRTRHIIAARRYRFVAVDHVAFVGLSKGRDRCLLLKSLGELAANITVDLQHGWFVDVECYTPREKHPPYLDYALLFGARVLGSPPTRELPPEGTLELPRVAYITHVRDRLLKLSDYAGVVVSDPVTIMLLMEDRFRADPNAIPGRSFCELVVSYLKEEHALISGTPGYTAKECVDALNAIQSLIDNPSAIVTPYKNRLLLDRGSASPRPASSGAVPQTHAPVAPPTTPRAAGPSPVSDGTEPTGTDGRKEQ